MSTGHSDITVIYSTPAELDADERKHVTNRLTHALRWITDEFEVVFETSPPKLRLIEKPDQ